jgi:hypothetical protein
MVKDKHLPKTFSKNTRQPSSSLINTCVSALIPGKEKLTGKNKHELLSGAGVINECGKVWGIFVMSEESGYGDLEIFFDI